MLFGLDLQVPSAVLLIPYILTFGYYIFRQDKLVEISEIKAAYQKAVDHPISEAQIYYVLHRQGWRKIMPRSRHPKKADEEVIATSKKSTRKSNG